MSPGIQWAVLQIWGGLSKACSCICTAVLWNLSQSFTLVHRTVRIGQVWDFHREDPHAYAGRILESTWLWWVSHWPEGKAGSFQPAAWGSLQTGPVTCCASPQHAWLAHALADGHPVPASSVYVETWSPLSSLGLFSPWVDPGPPKLKWNISWAWFSRG